MCESFCMACVAKFKLCCPFSYDFGNLTVLLYAAEIIGTTFYGGGIPTHGRENYIAIINVVLTFILVLGIMKVDLAEVM